jgi:hypothetical protein
MTDSAEELVCPSCGSTHAGDERFCRECGLPLVLPGGPGLEAELSDAQQRARKIKPQYAEGKLVRVAGGRNQIEAEFISMLLLEEGVPSVVRRAAGFDVPDFLTIGPRDVLVAESGLQAARDILLQADIEPSRSPSAGSVKRSTRVLAGVLLAIVVLALVLFMATHVAQ